MRFGKTIGVTAAIALAAALPGGATTAFSPEIFFAGTVNGEGTITTLFFWDEPFSNGFSGRVEGGWLLLAEQFAFADGTASQHWRLRRLSGGRYEGEVFTQGKDGTVRGPLPVDGGLDAQGFHLDYAGYAPNGGTTRYRFRHHLAPQPDGTVINDVRVSWWGIPLARSVAVFTKGP